MQQLTDIAGRGRDFYQQVFVVEIHVGTVYVHTYHQWGETVEQGKYEVFVPDMSRALAAPVFIPTGGNPKVAQGRYGLPVFPFFDHAQIANFKEISSFLERRLAKTFEGARYVKYIPLIAEQLQERIREAPDSKGLLVLCDMVNDSPYFCQSSLQSENSVRVGRCHNQEKYIWANLTWILDKTWWAKLEEGAAYGRSTQALCSFCYRSGEVVSLYSKAWPWYSLTWSGPLSGEINKHQLNETVALCQDCYAALSYGGKLFSDLSRRIHPKILQEAFKGNARSQIKPKYPQVLGTAFALPVWDNPFSERGFREDFLAGMRTMRGRKESGTDRHLAQIVGFDAWLPEEFAADIYRVTLVYYTQENADIQLWSVMEDVAPSALANLYDQALYDLTQYAKDLNWLHELRIPALLARAYGSGYLWQSLTKVLQLEMPSRERFIRRIATELGDLSKTVIRNGDTAKEEWIHLKDSAKFYLVFSRFLNILSVNETRKLEGGGLMRTWQELQGMVKGEPDDMQFGDNVEDLGFVIGHLVRRFANRFKSQTKKEYLSTRVMTFGSALTPDLAGFRGLGKIEELSLMLKIEVNQRFRQRIGVTLAEFTRQIDVIRKNRDAFMAAFWAGYGLSDLGYASKVPQKHEEETQP